jgi:predicted MPP superfamily phosphohydrolase
MKHAPVIIFLFIFFTLYGLINWYIFVRGWQALPVQSMLRVPYAALFAFLALSFIGGRFLEKVWVSPVSSGLLWIGSFWLAALLYFLLAVVLLDLLRLLNLMVPLFPSWLARSYGEAKLWTMAGLVGAVALALASGHVNALHPRITEIDIRLRKPLEGGGAVMIAAASDIHLGPIVGRRRFEKIVETINGLQPDLILLPGDIVDEDLAPVIRANLGEHLRSLHARLGVFAVTGNHEYIGGVESAVAYLREHGVTVLRDSAAVLPGGVTIIGREDRSAVTMAGRTRKTLAELLKGVDVSRPVVVLDHQPFHLEEAAEAGVDFQLSGHTHHGQLWPLNFITRAIYEDSWGYLRKGDTQYYVSSGVGTWGPPVRTGNYPEILSIRLLPG